VALIVLAVGEHHDGVDAGRVVQALDRLHALLGGVVDRGLTAGEELVDLAEQPRAVLAERVHGLVEEDLVVEGDEPDPIVRRAGQGTFSPRLALSSWPSSLMDPEGVEHEHDVGGLAVLAPGAQHAIEHRGLGNPSTCLGSAGLAPCWRRSAPSALRRVAGRNPYCAALAG
jgi:hypothetical protein